MLDFMATLAAFNRRVELEVWDTDGSYVDGTWMQTEEPSRIISAVVLQSSGKVLEFMPTGDLSDVVLGIHTYEQLFFNDLRAGGVQGRQSFLKFDDVVYRVVGSGQFSGNVASNQYQLRRYYSNDDHPTIP